MSDQLIPIKRSVVPGFVAQTDVPQKKESIYPTQVIPLPTKGWFYPEEHPLSSGEIELKEMTAREEDILSNQELIKKGKMLDKLLESVIINRAVKVEEILSPDKDAIFIAIRRFAYDDDYRVIVTCPSCAKQNTVVIKLGELSYKPFDFDKFQKGLNSFELTLPSGTTIRYKFLTQTDELAIDAEIKSLLKISKESSNELTTRFCHLITSVNGSEDKGQIRKFASDMRAKDSLAFRRHQRDNSPGVDLTFDFTCTECSHERRLDVPIGASFLWPDVES